MDDGVASVRAAEVADSDVVVSGMMVENADECMKVLVG